MLDKIINYSLKNKLIVLLFTLGLIAYGVFALMNISIGAVPDITNNQVQVITTSKSLATEDVEKFLTYPVELEMANLPGVKEIRSISKFGLSVVTIVFDDEIGTYIPRQLIAEKIQIIKENIPEGFGSPSMGPVSTGLGEIYQYILDTRPGYEDEYSISDLRTIQDWIVKRQLSGIPGVVEVNTWGGLLKTYEVSIDPYRLKSLGIPMEDVFSAMKDNNGIAGGGYIEKSNEAYFIRAEGLVASIEDIENIVVANRSGSPILIKDLAQVGYGHANRFGAITGNGEGEKVLGQVMMLKGASSNDVIKNVKERVAEVQGVLPEGVLINPFLERSELIGRTTFTIAENLILGCLIVIFIVIMLLGNVRSGLVVASIIPLSLLFALGMMHIAGVDANLMSLGAIDFGIIIDGAVIIVEYVAFRVTGHSTELTGLSRGAKREFMDKITFQGTSKMMHSAIFGQLIIIIVFIPILSLSGVEGKMFRPMALTFCFAIIGAMILCMTYVPVMSSLFIKPSDTSGKNLSRRLVSELQRLYRPVITLALKARYLVLMLATLLLIFAGFIFSQMGGEFVPTLDEGDFVIQPVFKTGMSLGKTVEMSTRMEKIIKRFPEVNQVVTRIGAAEVPTDPMSMEQSDVIVTLKPKSEWISAYSKDELVNAIQAAIEDEIPAVELEFTQPIEMRFNELITGVRADLAIKIFGEDLDVLYSKGLEIKNAIKNVEGAEDITVEKTAGLPQMSVVYDRKMIAKYGVNISELNDIISMGFAGMKSGTIFEGERQFDLILKYDKDYRKDIKNLENSLVKLPDGSQLPMSAFADIRYSKGPAKISRDDTRRRIVVGVNVRGRDLQSVADDVKKIIEEKINIPVGYLVQYGGQFENLQSAMGRLMVAVPISLILIFILLYFAFNSVKYALIIYSAIPLAAVGGILLLYIRDMPFSISAGVGFIALFGIAVLNGIVLIEHFKELKESGMGDIKQRVIQGTTERLRPVLLTATAAALGFLPMAISTSAGAEVQRPLATVVIGGLISATILTLFVLPALYTIFEKKSSAANKTGMMSLIIIGLAAYPSKGYAQKSITLDDAIQIAVENNLALKSAALEIYKFERLEGAAKEISKTKFYYGYDRSNLARNGSPLHVFGANQSFKLRSFHDAKKRVAESKRILSERSMELNKSLIIMEVSKAYNHIVYRQALINEYDYLDSLYQRFQTNTNRRMELGEGNRLEVVTASIKRKELRVMLEQANEYLAEAYIILNRWLQSDNDIIVTEKNFEKIAVRQMEIENHPIISYRRQLLDLANAEHNLQGKMRLPEFDISFFNGLNSITSFKWYPGIEAGIAVPLWHKNYDAREEATNIEIEINTMQIDHQQKMLSNEYAALEIRLKRFQLAIEEFEIFGKAQRQDLMETAQKSFMGGEIGLFEFVQSLENATEMTINYLENIFYYNQTAIDINYLIN